MRDPPAARALMVPEREVNVQVMRPPPGLVLVLLGLPVWLVLVLCPLAGRDPVPGLPVARVLPLPEGGALVPVLLVLPSLAVAALH